ncbi:class I SAM-dependent methyltransferase, partial [Klebsiella pneumoniae]|uniref:class I SAM-dependent methyltransferase n=1 Tax=Klebsiella pneumoniae TaxID=573 RepID=UPI003A8C068A
MQWAYDRYSFNVIPALGQAVTGDRDSYQYLVESIRRFPDQDAFADMIRAA